MKFRTTIILLALVIAAGLWLLFHTGSQLSDTDYDKAQKHVFPSHEYQSGEALVVRRLFERVVRLELRRGNNHLVFEREKPRPESLWRITQPVNTAADFAGVSSLLNAIGELRIERRVTGPVADPADYGLGQPQASVTFATPEKRWTLHVGALTTDDQSLYVNRADKPRQVLVVSKALLTDIYKDLTALRDKIALQFDGREMTGFELAAGGQLIVACALSDAGWQVSEPFHDEADIMHIVRIFERLAQTTIEGADFITDTPDDLSKFGLDHPIFSLTIMEKEKRKALLIGAISEDNPGKCYARRNDEDAVFLLPEAIIGALLAPAETFRAKTALLTYLNEVIMGIDISLPDERVRLKNSDDKWVFTPSGTPADSEEVSAFVNHLSTPNIDEWIDKYDDETLKQSGLATPQATITLTYKKAPKQTLHIGAVQPESGLRYARRSDTGPILLIRPELFNLIANGHLAFLSRLVLNFDPQDATLVNIQRPDRTVTLQREGQAWRLTEPVAGNAHEAQVAELLAKLSYLEAQRLIAAKPSDTAPFGLDQPRMAVTITHQPAADKEAQVRRLLIGKAKNKESVFAMIEDQKTVFLMSQAVVELLLVDFASDLVCSFNPKYARAVEIRPRAPAKVMRFERKGRVWTMTKPREVDARTRVVQELLGELKGLHAAAIGAYDQGKPEAAASFGLQSPAYIIRITLAEDAVRELRLGRPQGDHWTASSADAPYIFLLRKDQLAATLKLAGAQPQKE